MKKTGRNKGDLKAFLEFADASPLSPRDETDEAVYRMVNNLDRTALWRILTRFMLIHIPSGVLTLAVCPQFGIGADSHNLWLHSLHAADSPVLYYATCGVFFVLFGAVLSGLSFSRGELLSIGKKRFAWFALYSLCAYVVFILFGADAFLIGSLAWVGGAVAGNVLGFEVGVRLRAIQAEG